MNITALSQSSNSSSNRKYTETLSFCEYKAMDHCRVATTLDHLDQQLSLLTGVLLALLFAVTITFAVRGYKSLQEKRRGYPRPTPLKIPAEETSDDRGELVLHEMQPNVAHLSSSSVTTAPVQVVPTEKDELVVS